MEKGFVHTDEDVNEHLRSPLNLDKFDKLLERVERVERVERLKSEADDDAIKLGPYFTNIKLPFQTVEQFKYGQSNPTYLLTDANGLKLVLRRKPVPNAKLISKMSHNIEREFDFVSALGHYNKKFNADLPISKMYLLCTDESYIGTVFYLMEFKAGIIFHDPCMSSISESKRQKCWYNAVKTLSCIHRVNTDELKQFLPSNYFKSQSTSFFKRQVKTLSKVSHAQAQKVSAIPYFEETSQWLLQNAPEDTPKPTLIHGDYKIDNLIFDPDSGEVVAVLDWELTTLGHPVFDLSNLLQPCILPEDMSRKMNKSALSEPFDNSVKLCLEQYYRQNANWGDPQKCWKSGVVFGLYRVAVITQGVYQRSKEGVASSAEADQFGRLFTVFGNLAMNYIRKESKM